MRNNVMFWPAVILMILEAVAVIFLIREWRKAKQEQEEEDDWIVGV